MTNRPYYTRWMVVWGYCLVLLLGLVGQLQAVIGPEAHQAPITGSGSPLRIELDLPPYLPTELRHPQNFFSARMIRILGNFPAVTSVQAELRGVRRSTTRPRMLPSKKTGPGFTSFEIPEDTPTGSYNVTFSIGGTSYSAPIDITGLEPADLQFSQDLTTPLPLDAAILHQSDLNCGGCFWELVVAGHPTKADHLFVIGSSGPEIRASHDGAGTWQAVAITGLTYIGDPKSLVTPAGTLLLSGLVYALHPNPAQYSYVYAGGLFQGAVVGSTLHGTYFKGVPQDLLPEINHVMDFPKLAYDSQTQAIYVAGSTRYNESPPRLDGRLYISRDGAQTFTEKEDAFGRHTFVWSMDTAPSGSLRAVTVERLHLFREARQSLWRFNATADVSEEVAGILLPNWWTSARVSATSPRAWQVSLGPEIVVDNSSTSTHRGRIYMAWARAESVVEDSSFEHRYYGSNYDVYLAYSDDDGQTWSSPMKVNDDVTQGDQVFPSLRLDANGVVHIAFLDRRENPDLAQFDVYYALVRDGVLSKNIRVNGAHVANALGGRSVGDYLDMVLAYPDKVYVAYPCEGAVDRPTDACATALDPRLVPSPPALQPISNQLVNEGQRLEFTVAAIDPNSDPLTVTARLSNGDPLSTLGASFIDHGDGTGTFSWTPSYSQAGSYSVIFTVSDGEFENSEMVTITVLDEPDPDHDSLGFGDYFGLYFRNGVEGFLGTDSSKACAATTVADDEPVDAWPPDFNDDRTVDGSDLFLFAQRFGTQQGVPPPIGKEPYAPRFDLYPVDASKDTIDGSDVFVLAVYFGKSCTP